MGSYWDEKNGKFYYKIYIQSHPTSMRFGYITDHILLYFIAEYFNCSLLEADDFYFENLCSFHPLTSKHNGIGLANVDTKSTGMSNMCYIEGLHTLISHNCPQHMNFVDFVANKIYNE